MRKNKTKQRLTAMMLSAIMVVGMMPVSALAETDTLFVSIIPAIWRKIISYL